MNLRKAIDKIMTEAWATVDKDGTEHWNDSDDDSDIADLYGDPSGAFDDGRGSVTAFHAAVKAHKGSAKPTDEADKDEVLCELCGGSMQEGTCVCSPAKDEVNESSLRLAISRILGEMKLGVAGGGHFDWGTKDDSPDEDVELASFLLSKKKNEPKPEEKKKAPSKKLGTSKKRGKSSQFR